MGCGLSALLEFGIMPKLPDPANLQFPFRPQALYLERLDKKSRPKLLGIGGFEKGVRKCLLPQVHVVLVN
jgi:hypothetical protein